VKNILILGGSGTIGNALYKELSPYYNSYITYFTKKNTINKKKIFFDLSISSLVSILKFTQPKLIINSLRGEPNKLINIQNLLVDYCINNNCRLMHISGANVFDAFHNYPSYEYDKTLSESKYGKLQIKMENAMIKLRYSKKVIIRTAIVFGRKSKRIMDIDYLIENKIPLEVFPNLIINFSSLNRLTQQIHFIINQMLSGIFHLGTNNLITHSELIEKIAYSRFMTKVVYKRIYTSNEIRYLALLSKKNKLPKHLNYSIDDAIKDLEPISKKV
tara:strand:- start:4768 stop:5589 length:822 start_codon:yes stop_codon:yes gene_type:complete